jgi:hypothetical protein
MFLKVIACEVAFREICHCAARSVNQFDMEFLSQGYHDNPEIGLQRLQACIDETAPERFEAILLGYGLCNNMLSGLQARQLPVVIPRAHDCITFFLGSKERYQRCFAEIPGTYYYTAGWLEYRQRGGERPVRRQGAELGDSKSYEEMVAQYGEDNARYLVEFLGAWTRHYSRGALIDFDFTAHLSCKDQVRSICQQHGWEYAEIPGDLTLLRDWMDGRWNADDFLVVQPGERVRPSYDRQIVQIEPPTANQPS